MSCLGGLWARVPVYKALRVSGDSEQPIREYLYHLTDSTGRLDIVEAIKAQKAGKFESNKSPTNSQNFGYNTHWHWWYFELQAGESAADLMLEMEYANLDHLELFEVRNGQIRSLGISGDAYPFERRTLSNSNYVYQLRLQPQQRVGYFLHIEQRNAILSFFIRLWQTSYFKQLDRHEYGAWGVFLGLALVVFAVNLVMFAATRDFIFFWYDAYLLAVTVHLLADAGLGFQYCWPQWPSINVYDPVYLSAWVGIVVQLTFMQYFIRQNRHNSKLFAWLMAYKWLVTGVFLGVVLIHSLGVPGKELYMYRVVSTCTPYFVVGYILLAELSLFELRRQRGELVRYYRYALRIQFAGYVAVILFNIGQTKGWQMPFDIETYVIMAVTVVLDMAFFSYGLAYRYQLFNQENEALMLAISRTRQEATQKVIQTLEEERRRIAQDLHDDVGATLATAKGYLSMLGREPAWVHTLPLKEAQRYLDQASEDLRIISHNLMPKGFSKIGLSKALEESIRKASRPGGLDLAYACIGTERKLQPTVEMQIFRIAVGLVNHIQKHSEASEATVQLMYHADYVMIMTEDNGKGFGHNLAAGQGLQNLRARAAFINASMSIDSSETGTTVFVEIPYRDQESPNV